MLLAYYVLLIIFIITVVVLFAMSFKKDGANSDILEGIMYVCLVFISVIAVIGLIGSSKTGKIYRTAYDKLIQSIDKNKTRVIEEDDEITDIYITVNGEEHHFKIKEKTTDE